MPNTYVALDTRTLGANADDITFSNIPASYTDLVLVIVAAEATANTNGLRVRVGNNTIDTGNNYSNTSKNKTLRSLGGFDANGSGVVWLTSNLWMSTAAINSIVITATIPQNARFTLYGVR